MKYCFIGLESAQWQLADFPTAAQTIVDNGYDTVVWKAGEGQSNLWYSDADFRARHSVFRLAGLHSIPYVFLYGNSQGSDVASEAKLCNHILSLCGEICLDMESGFDGKPQDAHTLVQQLSKGIIHISTWANIIDHAWIDVVAALQPMAKSIWPQVYTAYDARVWPAQYRGVTLPIYPTYAQATFPGADLPANAGYWELATVQKGPFMSVIRNSKGENADIALTTQFEKDETEFACGFFTAAACKYAGIPGKGPAGTPEQVDVWADNEYTDQYGSAGPTQTGGVSVDDMHRLLNAAGAHYFDILAITPISAQASDIAHVRAALDAGYIVAITVDESTVHDLDLNGANPYEWNPQPGQSTHVFLLTGPGQPASYLLAEDWANVVGPLQGNNTVRQGPRRYDENKIGIHWACVVQLVGPDATHPWMKPIPDPASWPQGFNCQNFGGTHPMNWPSQGMQQQAQDTWLITTKFLQALFGSDAPYTTGIALAWQERYKKGKNYGPPICPEQNSVNWDTPPKPIKVQLFVAGVRAEWDGSCHWFDKDGPLP